MMNEQNPHQADDQAPALANPLHELVELVVGIETEVEELGAKLEAIHFPPGPQFAAIKSWAHGTHAMLDRLATTFAAMIQAGAAQIEEHVEAEAPADEQPEAAAHE